jgi:hypothetical protein
MARKHASDDGQDWCAPKLRRAEVKSDTISTVLTRIWGVSQARRAAEELCKLGFTSSSLWRWHKTEPARYIDEVWYNNTYNEMVDMEILARRSST